AHEFGDAVFIERFARIATEQVGLERGPGKRAEHGAHRALPLVTTRDDRPRIAKRGWWPGCGSKRNRRDRNTPGARSRSPWRGSKRTAARTEEHAVRAGTTSEAPSGDRGFGD